VTVILLITWNKHRTNTAHGNTTHVTQSPPHYGAGDQAVPMEKYGHNGAPAQAQQTPQQQYAQPVQQQYVQQPQQPQQQQYMQPFQQQGPYGQQPQQHIAGPTYQDPVPRQDTVSPASSAAYGYAPPSNVSELNSPHPTGGAYPPNASELSTPQPTGGAYPPNASELSTPQHTQHPGSYNPNVPELSNQK
jgi:hypothetical protein